MAFSRERKDIISEIFQEWSGEDIREINPLPPSGSQRSYYRIKGKSKTALAAHNPDQKENDTFIYLSKYFKNAGLKVPEIYFYAKDKHIYLLEDLGNSILFNQLIDKKNEKLSAAKLSLIEKSLKSLVQMQTQHLRNLDFSRCYPREKFDAQSIQWDLNYFKYHFLKVFDIQFNEQNLENDFQILIKYLTKVPAEYFMFRDFQSRNIIIKNNEAFFIDYQGGRKGPLQYDLVSFLFQVRLQLPWDFKMQMLDFYIKELIKHGINPEKNFREHFFTFAYLRLMQVLGAYGYRGIIQNKAHFLISIPFAVKTLKELMHHYQLSQNFCELQNVFDQMCHLKLPTKKKADKKLLINIHSFSYKKGFPVDYSGNGGGHIFDCRALPNPGRLEQYKSSTGKDANVIEYLNKHHEVTIFSENCYKIVSQSVHNYVERGFQNLSVSFGCTGGQHRSVFCAENLFKKVKNLKGVEVRITHKELKN